MRTFILFFFLFSVINSSAQEILRIDFAGQTGEGWQNGKMDLHNKEWGLDASGLVSSAGIAGVDDNGQFMVRGCEGDLVFWVRKLSINAGTFFRIRLETGEKQPDRELCWEMEAVGNAVWVENKSGRFGMEVNLIVEEDSLQLLVRLKKLRVEDYFCISRIVVENVGEPEATICYVGVDDTLKLCPLEKYGTELPVVELKVKAAEKELNLKQLEFYADSAIQTILSGAELVTPAAVYKSSVFTDQKLRFYKTEGLVKVSPWDSVILHLKLKPYRQLVKDGQYLKLTLNDKSFGYTSGSGEISRPGQCRLPVMVTRIEGKQLQVLDYNYVWQEEQYCKLAYTDGAYNVDESSKTASRLEIWKSGGEKIRVSDTVFTGIWDYKIKGLEKAGYRIVINGGVQDIEISGEDYEKIYEENFDRFPVGWKGVQDWKVENGRLYHALLDVSGNSWFCQRIDMSKKKRQNLVWKAQIETGDWQVSSVNYFRYYLLVDTLEANYKKALYFTVNSATKEEMLILEMNGSRDTLWQGGRIWWNNEAYELEIMYRNTGEWQIRLGRNGGFLQKVGETVQLLPSGFFDEKMVSGMFFKYTTASRAGKLNLGYLSFCSFDSPGRLLNYEIIGDSIIALHYSRLLDVAVFPVDAVFELWRDGAAWFVDSVQISGEGTVLLYTRLLTGNYQLQVSGLQDSEKASVSAVKLNFYHVSAAHTGDVVINEIMYKPKEGKGLPKVEYAELYNLRDYSLKLDDVEWIDRGKVRDFISDTIAAHGYLILGGPSIDTLKNYGKVYRIKNFVLVDDSAAIVLKRRMGEVIDSVYYKSYWIRDKHKRSEGGYALERIFPEKRGDDVLNWYESVAEKGGTPGEQNSVYGNCPDQVAPEILTYRLTETLDLLFSENVIPESAVCVSAYRLEPDYGYPLKVEVKNNWVSLFFSRSLKSGEEVRLFVSGVRDGCGNVMRDTVLNLFLPAEPQPGEVLLNELLYEAQPADAEYIEFYNNSDQTFDLKDIRIAKRKSDGELYAWKQLADTTVYFPPRSLVWICSLPEMIVAHFGYNCLENCRVMATKLALPDEGGTIVVVNNKQQIIDELTYGKFLHNPLVKERKNVALERVGYEGGTNNSLVWTSAAGDAAGGWGSPGLPNRAVARALLAVNKTGLTRRPEVITPDGDGNNDEVEIIVDEEGQTFSVKIGIYTARGELINSITHGSPVQNRGVFYWDGTNGKGSLVPAGIYVIYAEVVFVNGQHKIYRKTCVVSR